jgi:hypothetical protein
VLFKHGAGDRSASGRSGGRYEGKMSRPIINGQDPNWSSLLHSYLSKQTEVDLLNFDFEQHGTLCENLARQFSMEMRLDREPTAKAVHFRTPSR